MPPPKTSKADRKKEHEQYTVEEARRKAEEEQMQCQAAEAEEARKAEEEAQRIARAMSELAKTPNDVVDASTAIKLLRTATEKRKSSRAVDAVLAKIAGRLIKVSEFSEVVAKLDLSRAELVSLLDAAEELEKETRPAAPAPVVQEEPGAQERAPGVDVTSMFSMPTKKSKTLGQDLEADEVDEDDL